MIIGHTTFCIVLVFNNVLARLRRLPPSFEEASRDLGASGLQTFRYVTFPSIRTALIAGRCCRWRSPSTRSLSRSSSRAPTHDAAPLDPGCVPQQPQPPRGERGRDGDPAGVAAVIAIAVYLMREEGGTRVLEE